jgi:hypothetical protein
MNTVLLVVVILLLLVIAALVLWILLRLRRLEPQPEPEPPVVDPDDVIPSTLDEGQLSGFLGVRLRGQPASLETGDAVVVDDATPDAPGQVIWVDGGDEALVHLDSLTSRISGQTLVVSLDLETDQTGRAPVIVRFALGGPDEPAGLLATTDAVAHGHPVLVSRWGAAVQAAVWSSLVALGVDHAGQRGGVAGGLAIGEGRLVLRARAPIRLERVDTEAGS